MMSIITGIKTGRAQEATNSVGYVELKTSKELQAVMYWWW
jgi:hypothetical protein